jgi:hypothetical protein
MRINHLELDSYKVINNLSIGKEGVILHIVLVFGENG